MNTRKVTVLTACLIVSLGALAIFGGAAAQDEKPTPLEDELKMLLNQRVETARKAHEATQAAFDAQTVTLDVVLAAAYQLSEAKLAVAPTPEKEIELLKERVELTKQIERKVKALFDMAARGGEPQDYYRAKYERESAEIALVKARIRIAR